MTGVAQSNPDSWTTRGVADLDIGLHRCDCQPFRAPPTDHCLEKGLRVTRVYVDMVADLFHYGHIAFLKKARALGVYLLVGIHADDVLVSYKKGKPILTMEERVDSVAGCRHVDEVLPNAPFIIDRAWIEKHDIRLVVRGDDFSQDQLEYFYKVPIEMGIFRTVPYTPGISTSEIIRRVIDAGA